MTPHTKYIKTFRGAPSIRMFAKRLGRLRLHADSGGTKAVKHRIKVTDM